MADTQSMVMGRWKKHWI